MNLMNLVFLIWLSLFTSFIASAQVDSDPYAVLGVSTSQSLEDIRERYVFLVKKHHPDHHAQASLEQKTLLSNKLAEINGAFDFLKAHHKPQVDSTTVRSNETVQKNSENPVVQEAVTLLNQFSFAQELQIENLKQLLFKDEGSLGQVYRSKDRDVLKSEVALFLMSYIGSELEKFPSLSERDFLSASQTPYYNSHLMKLKRLFQLAFIFSHAIKGRRKSQLIEGWHLELTEAHALQQSAFASLIERLLTSHGVDSNTKFCRSFL